VVRRQYGAGSFEPSHAKRTLVRTTLAALLCTAAAIVAAPSRAQHVAAPGATSAPIPANSNDAAVLESAKADALELMRAGRFAEALSPSERALKLAGALHGAEAVESAVAAHNLGFLLRRANRDSDALPHLERALAIYERVNPAVHEDTRNLARELAQIYMALGRAPEVDAIYQRLITRAGAEGYGNHIGVAHMLTNRAFVLRNLARHDDSEAAFRRAVALYDANSDATSDAYDIALNALLDRLDATGRHEQASAAAATAIDRLVKTGGPALQTAARLHNRRSAVALEAGRYAEARTQAEAALALAGAPEPRANAHGALDPYTSALNNLARAYRAVANYTAAEDNYRRAIKILDETGDKANAGILYDNLAVLYLHQGRLDEAEAMHKRGLADIEASLGRDHRSAGFAATNLGTMLNEAGRHAEAEPLLRRGLAIAEAQLPQNKTTIGIVEDNLAGLLRVTGRPGEARAGYARALAAFEASLPPRHPRIATTRNNLGRFLLDAGDYPAAEVALKRALDLAETLYGVDSFEIAVPASNLGEVYTATKRFDEARNLFDRSLAALTRVHGASHSNLLYTLVASGRLELADGKAAAAKALFERAVAIELATDAHARKRAAHSASEKLSSRGAFLGLVDALWQSGASGDARDAARALEAAQWDSLTSTTGALAARGARAGTNDPGLSVLTRDQQDLAAEWQVVDRRLTEVLAETQKRDTALENELRARIAAIDTRLQTLNTELGQRFPRYLELAKPSALAVDAMRRLLAPDEVAIQFLVSPQSTDVWLVSQSAVTWHRVSIPEREMKDKVRALRCGLDRGEWNGPGRQICAGLLGLVASFEPKDSEPLPFDAARAHQLYDVLFGPLKASIAKKDLLIVASGPLTTLPLHVLVTEPPKQSGTSDYAGVAWLGRSNAITMLPSLASLAPLRQLARSSKASKPYLGIGNPLLTGIDGHDRSAFDVPPCEIQPQLQPRLAVQSPKRNAGLARSVARSVARSPGVEALRQQPPLPETAGELCRVARFAGAEADTVITGARATEDGIKALSQSGRLADARVLHFATHGLLATETALFLSGKAEPSLMLTPPPFPTITDDGLLTASEVAALKLDADWVVLSACNTASGDGGDAEALSGLARAFFYAGARSLLVSHWAVDSDATVKLITATFAAMTRDPRTTQSRALMQAMGTLIQDGGRTAHPANWAPFVVVGGSAPVTSVAAATPVVQPAPKAVPKALPKSAPVKSEPVKRAASAASPAPAAKSQPQPKSRPTGEISRPENDGR
jgi:CHAT domain-containing protein/tetratricopeptide (TPR) repeat protein